MTDSAPHTDRTANPPDWEAIARYLSGETNPREAEAVRRWLDAHAADQTFVEALEHATVTPDTVEDVDVEVALRRVHARMERAAPSVSLGRPRSRWASSARLIGLALAAVLVFAVVRLASRHPGDHQQSAAPRAANTIATGVGQIDSLVLADGTRIVLGPASRLMIATNYGSSGRDVTLRGEGFFVVRHDASRPFSVHTTNAVMQDLGTTFAVTSDSTNGTTYVSVLTGRVRLSSAAAARSSAELGAGDRGIVTGAGTVTVYANAVAGDDTAWTSGRLVFHDASLADVIGAIRRTYGVDVHVADTSLLGRHVTATFNGETVDKVLQIVGLALGARVQRTGDSAMVYSARAPAARQ